MARVVVVHGINNTFSGPSQMEAQWCAPLLDGVHLAGGDGLLDSGQIGYVCYGDVFRPAGVFLGDEIPPLTADDVTEVGLEADLLRAWWRAAARVDSGVVSSDADTLGGRGNVRAAIRALSGSRFLAHVSERMLVWWLKQVAMYFSDPLKRQMIQRRFAEQIGIDTRVVVAHSLGSVVAYEALCANLSSPVTDLVSLGSPLGIPHIVLDRLHPAPAEIVDATGKNVRLGMWPGVHRWVNLTEEGDFVALQPLLRSMFGSRVVDVQISNGMGAHQVERYLSAAETGSAVIAGLR